MRSGPPFVVYVAAYGLVAPPVAALLARRRLDPARAWLLAWCLISVVATMGQRVFARSGNNHAYSYFAAALDAPLVLWALSYWQLGAVARQAMRIAVPISVAVYVAIVLLLENTMTFSAAAVPFLSLLGAAAALYTLVSRAIDETEPLWRRDWFWITIAQALYFGIQAIAQPLARLVLGSNVELLVRAWEWSAVASIAAQCLLTVGMLCPLSPTSGLYSSPAFSASASSLPRSAPR